MWSVPTLFVIDPQGRFAYINVPRVVDPEVLAKQLRETIAQALPKEQVAYDESKRLGELSESPRTQAGQDNGINELEGEIK